MKEIEGEDPFHCPYCGAIAESFSVLDDVTIKIECGRCKAVVIIVEQLAPEA